MNFGLPDQVIKSLQEVFRKHPSIEKVTLYGSRAKGNYKNGSDIDLCMSGKTIDFSEISRISDEIDDLMLPYKTDLSLDREIENPDLLAHIERIGLIFYQK